MNRRQFLSLAATVPFSRDARAMTPTTRYPSCTCGDFEPGPMLDTNGPVQCENCRGWVNVSPSPAAHVIGARAA